MKVDQSGFLKKRLNISRVTPSENLWIICLLFPINCRWNGNEPLTLCVPDAIVLCVPDAIESPQMLQAGSSSLYNFIRIRRMFAASRDSQDFYESYYLSPAARSEKSDVFHLVQIFHFASLSFVGNLDQPLDCVFRNTNRPVEILLRFSLKVSASV